MPGERYCQLNGIRTTQLLDRAKSKKGTEGLLFVQVIVRRLAWPPCRHLTKLDAVSNLNLYPKTIAPYGLTIVSGNPPLKIAIAATEI